MVRLDDHPAPFILVAFCLGKRNSDLEGFSMSIRCSFNANSKNFPRKHTILYLSAIPFQIS